MCVCDLSGTLPNNTEAAPMDRERSGRLLTLRVLFGNQPSTTTSGGSSTNGAPTITNTSSKSLLSPNAGPQWYCIGIGNHHLRQIWFPFDDRVNLQIEEQFQAKTATFTLAEGSPALSVRFGHNAFGTAIPFGFASNVHPSQEEVLIVRHHCDYFGYMNAHPVALYPFASAMSTPDTLHIPSSPSSPLPSPSIPTMSECHQLCCALYPVFDEESDSKTADDIRSKVHHSNIDGVKIRQFMNDLDRKQWGRTMKTQCGIGLGPARKLNARIAEFVEMQNAANYSVYDMMELMSTETITTRQEIRNCVFSRRVTLRQCLESKEAATSLVSALRSAFAENAKTRNNEMFTHGDQHVNGRVMDRLKKHQFANTFIDIIFGDERAVKHQHGKMEEILLKQSDYASDPQQRGHTAFEAVADVELKQCDIYLNGIRRKMAVMVRDDVNLQKLWMTTADQYHLTSFVVHCFDMARIEEMNRVSVHLMACQHALTPLDDIGDVLLSDDKATYNFLESVCGIEMDQDNEFLVKQLRVRLDNDINEWISSLVYRRFEIEQLKDSLRKFIRDRTVTSEFLQKHSAMEFADLAHKSCGGLMIRPLALLLYRGLTEKPQRKAPRNHEVIFNDAIKFVDKWWALKQRRLQEKCVSMEMDKATFVAKVRSASWDEVRADLELMVNESAPTRPLSAVNVDEDSKRMEDDTDFVYNLGAMVILIRLCCDNDLFGDLTFGEWLLNLLEDSEEFNLRMKSARDYIVGEDVNAHKLHTNEVRRKDFATRMDECDIPRGVSTKLHKELLKEIKEHLDWTADEVYHFVFQYMMQVTKTKKIKIIEKVQKEKIGKLEFMEHYARPPKEAKSKIYHFLRTKIEYTKKGQLLEEMTHRIQSCIDLHVSPDQLDFSSFEDEEKRNEDRLHFLRSDTSSGPSLLTATTSAPPGRLSVIQEDPTLGGPYKLTVSRTTMAPGTSGSALTAGLTIGSRKDIRLMIAENLYPVDRIQEQIGLAKQYVVEHDMGSNRMMNMGKKSLCQTLETECQIPKGITAKLFKKVTSTNELSPNQMVDYISDHLHEIRDRKVKEIEDSISKQYPAMNEEQFVRQVVQQEEHLNDLLKVKLGKYLKDPVAMYADQIRKEVELRTTPKGGSSHLAESHENTRETPIGSEPADFVQYLCDLAFGSDAEWEAIQERLTEHFVRHDVDIMDIQKTTFSNLLGDIAKYPKGPSGRLFKELKVKSATRQEGYGAEDLTRDIIDGIGSYRKEKVSDAVDKCAEAKITRDSWASREEAATFLKDTLKLKQSVLDRVVGKIFATRREGVAFADWLSEVCFPKYEADWMCRRIAKYMENETLEPPLSEEHKTEHSTVLKITTDGLHHIHDAFAKHFDLDDSLSRDILGLPSAPPTRGGSTTGGGAPGVATIDTLSVEQIINILENVVVNDFATNTAVMANRGAIVEYFRSSNINGSELAGMGRKQFSNHIVEHCKGGNKLRGPAAKIYKMLTTFDVTALPPMDDTAPAHDHHHHHHPTDSGILQPVDDMLSADDIAQRAERMVTHYWAKQREFVRDQCKTKHLENHSVFIREYAQSVDDLVSFLQNALELELPLNVLVLIARKLHFYVHRSCPLDVHDGEQFIQWQCQCICFAKALYLCPLYSALFRVEDLNGSTWMEMKRNDFGRLGSTFGIVKGSMAKLFKVRDGNIRNGDSVQMVVDKVTPLVFEYSLEQKAIDTLLKKAKENGNPLLTEVSKLRGMQIHGDAVGDVLTALKEKDIDNEDGSAILCAEMGLCLCLQQMERLSASQPGDMAVGTMTYRTTKETEMHLDLTSLDEMNPRQIAVITCNVMMRAFKVQIEEVRTKIISKFNDVNGRALYLSNDGKERGDDDDYDTARTLKDASAEVLADIAIQCLDGDPKHSHKMKQFRDTIIELKMDGQKLFATAVEEVEETSEEVFIEEMCRLMEQSANIPQSNDMKLIYKLMYHHRLEWRTTTTDELMDYAETMCAKNIKSIIIENDLTGAKVADTTKRSEFVQIFQSHSNGCCLAKGGLLNLRNAILTYSFESDLRYKGFIQKELGFGNMNLAKQLIADFEKSEKKKQVRSLSNHQLARYISQYPINQLHDILIEEENSNAEDLRNQLDSKVLDELCGFDYFIGGNHTHDMIEEYWKDIARQPKELLTTDLRLSLQLLAAHKREEPVEERVVDLLFKMDRNGMSLNHVLHHGDDVQSFLEEEKSPYLWQRFEKFKNIIALRDSKFTLDWDPLEVDTFLLQQMSVEVEQSKNIKNGLQRILQSMKTPYELLLALNDFGAFSKFSVNHKISAKKLFDLDKMDKLYSTLKSNDQHINDQTGHLYAQWIKEKLLRSEYINIAKTARQMFSKQAAQDPVQFVISEQVEAQRLSFDLLAEMKEETEFVDTLGLEGELKIYNARCCQYMCKEMKIGKLFDAEEVAEWKKHEIIRWFTTYRRQQIYRIMKHRKLFTWKDFAEFNEDSIQGFYDKMPILTLPESTQLFKAMHHEYLRKASHRKKRSEAIGFTPSSLRSGISGPLDSSSSMLLGLPVLLDGQDICASDHYYCCDGSCHDASDAMHYIQTSFGQLLLYMKAAHGEIESYQHLKQLWYDRMYRNEPTLFNNLGILHSDTFDIILNQIQQHDAVQHAVDDCLKAFAKTAFIKELNKYDLSTSSEVQMQFLMKIVGNMDALFEAKYIFFALLNAVCRGREQYEFEHSPMDVSYGNHRKSQSNPWHNAHANFKGDSLDHVPSERFTIEEARDIRLYLKTFDALPNNGLSCSQKYYLRSVLSAIIRVSSGIKRGEFSSIDGSNKPMTMFLPWNDDGNLQFESDHSLVIPTEQYKSEDHAKRNAVLLRLQTTASYFGTHFVDLTKNGDSRLNQMAADEQCDGHLFAPFRVNHAVQRRLRIPNNKRVDQVVQYLCTDIQSMALDQLDPFLSIQQYSNVHFVLFRMFHVLLSHHHGPPGDLGQMDNKQISEIFFKKNQEQIRSDLKTFLSTKCNLEAADVDNLLISDPKMNDHTRSLSDFLWIDSKTLAATQISNASNERIMKEVETRREKFFENVRSVLLREFPDLENIKMMFKGERIATFDHDVFYDEKRLEQLLPHCRQRSLLLHCKFVLKAYFKKAHRHFLAAKRTLEALSRHDGDHFGSFDRSTTLKRVFGALYETLSHMKHGDAIATEDMLEDGVAINGQTEDGQVAEVAGGGDDGKEEESDPNKVLLESINALELGNANKEPFEFVFLPKFENISVEQRQIIQSIMRSYFAQSAGKKYVEYTNNDSLTDVIVDKQSTTNCFVLIGTDVIGYIDDIKEDRERREDTPTFLLNAALETVSSSLQIIKIQNDDDGERCAQLMHHGERGQSIENEVDIIVRQLVYSDAQQNANFEAFENRLMFQYPVKSIQAQCALDLLNSIRENTEEHNQSQSTKSVDQWTDPREEWENMDFCIYDIVQLDSNLCSVWNRNHRTLQVDNSVYGIVTRLELANTTQQEQYHQMIMDSLQQLLDDDLIQTQMKKKGEELTLYALCRQQPWIWAIGDKLKCAHRALQIVTVDWHTASGDIVRGVYPTFGHLPFIKRVVDVPRIFDVVIYNDLLCYVYSIKLKANRDLQLNIIYCSIGNKADLTKKMMSIRYSPKKLQIVTPSLAQWQLARSDAVWFLPIYLNDGVIRKVSGKVPGKICKIWTDHSLDGSKLPLIHVEVEWMIPSAGSQNVFVWLGIGHIEDNAQFKYTSEGGKVVYTIANELQLISLECNDRVSRGLDWDNELFQDQDHNQDGNNLLGKVSKIEIEPKRHGGYEIEVMWDNQMTFNYRHGLSSKFDVEVIQRTSRVKQRPMIHCGDRVVRAVSWKWDDQDKAIVDTKRNVVVPQIGMVKEIFSQQFSQHDEDEDEEQIEVETKPVTYWVKEHSQRIHSVENESNIDDDATAMDEHKVVENDTLVYVEWIADSYGEGLEEEPIEAIDDGMLDYKYHPNGEKYRFGLKGAYDVTVVGQHTPISLGPRSEWIEFSDEKSFSDYEKQMAWNMEADTKDVLMKTSYRARSRDEGEGPRWEQYIKDMKTGKATKWPQPVVDRLNQRTRTFVTRFVDTKMLKQ